jgi:hypothetical protein
MRLCTAAGSTKGVAYFNRKLGYAPGDVLLITKRLR